MTPLVAAIDWHTVFFLLFAAVACLCAIAVVVATNVVRMALYLVLSLGATAGLFFLAGAEFVGAMQLMIYVGGTLVLLVFGVMLTAQAPFVSIKTTTGDRVLAGVVGAALLAVLLQSAFSVPAWRQPAAGAVAAPAATPIGMALLGVRVDEPAAGATHEAGARERARHGQQPTAARVAHGAVEDGVRDRLREPRPVERGARIHGQAARRGEGI